MMTKFIDGPQDGLEQDVNEGAYEWAFPVATPIATVAMHNLFPVNQPHNKRYIYKRDAVSGQFLYDGVR